MTTDAFTTAARAHARERYPSGTDLDRDRRMVVDEFAECARGHLARQEVTGAEVTAVILEHHRRTGRTLTVEDARAALTAARKARA